MSANVSLFSGYNQRENRHTNYCLLLLRLLYEENPSFLEEALSTIAKGKTSATGVEFTQQRRYGDSIPDGVISQAPFTIFIETKDADWFYDDQIERHLDALSDEGPGEKILLALSKFENGKENRFTHIEELCEEKYKGTVTFSAVSFEEFLEAVRVEGLPKDLTDKIEELQTYMDREGLLPKWKTKLDACGCTQSMIEQRKHHVYICPAQGGAYSHRRCRFFGAYKNKRVQYIAEIAGIVDVEPGEDGDAEIQWRNSDNYTDGELIAEASRRKMNARPDVSYAARVFVLDDMTETAFRKHTSGGMRGSKQYFDVEEYDTSSAPALAESLNEVAWREVQG
jgi:hypothetical protein